MNRATVNRCVCGLVWSICTSFGCTPRSSVVGRWEFWGQISDWVYFLHTQQLGHLPYSISWNLLSRLHSPGPDTVPGGNEASKLSEEILGLHLCLGRPGLQGRAALRSRRGRQTFPLLIWFESTSWGGAGWRQEGEREARVGDWQGAALLAVLPGLHRTFPTPSIIPAVPLLRGFCGSLCPPAGVWIPHCGLRAPPCAPPACRGLPDAVPRSGKWCPAPLTETDGGA